MEETRAIVHYLYDKGIRLICVSGTSMGSLCTNMTLGTLDIPVASVCFLPSDSLGGFWYEIISKSGDWERVAKDAPIGEPDNIAFDKTKNFVLDCFEKYTSVRTFKQPLADDCSI